jgi:exopolysaccharide biosynthesis polyprenyl glycosylphosphotransferase
LGASHQEFALLKKPPTQTADDPAVSGDVRTVPSRGVPLSYPVPSPATYGRSYRPEEWQDDPGYRQLTFGEVAGPELARVLGPPDDGRDLSADLLVNGPTSRTRRNTWRIVLLGDLIAMTLAVGIGLVFFRPTNPDGSGSTLPVDVLMVSLFPLCQLLFFAILGRYRQGRRLRPSTFWDIPIILGALVAGSMVAQEVVSDLDRLRSWPMPSLADTFAIILAAAVFSLVARTLTLYTSRARKPTRVLIIGSGMVANRVKEYLGRDSGTVVVGFVDDDPVPPARTLGTPADLPMLCDRLQIDRVLVTFSRHHPKDLTEGLRQIQGSVAIGIVPRYFELLTWRSVMDELCGLPIIDVAPPSIGRVDQVMKRTLDLVLSLLALVVLSPLMVAIAVLVKVTSKGPILFRQRRIGRHGEEFRICKFRTMCVNAEDLRMELDEANEVDGPIFKLRCDPRVTTVGRYLRKLSLDELPQLFNVVAGSMSLVGPRPFVVAESQKIDGFARRRFDARPGLTGLWQVSGRNDLSAEDLERLDYVYVASWSLTWDLKILLQTPATVIRGQGAY